MKRLIVTICSLALSVAGTLGVNQLSLNNNDAVNTNSDKTEAVQYADNAGELNSLPADTQTEAAYDTAKAETTDTKEAAPAAAKTEDKAKAEVKTAAAKEETAKKSDSGVKNTKAEAPAAKTATTAKAAPMAATNNMTKATPVSNNTKAQTVAANTQNKQAYVYKNVDLSQCDNTQEVVKKLQQNGFSNININNVDQIKSLEDVLALINGNSTKAPTPTKAPVQTTPTPTKAPVQTTPAPTKAPVQTTPTPTKAPTNNNTGISNYANQVLQLINQERAKAGLSALTTNSTLQAAAEKRAQETVQSFSHTRPNGTSFSSVLKEYGISYRTSGENIAYGQKSPQEVVTAWMNSSGHRANIMNGNFGKVGIGVYQKNGVIYWSQLFTN